MKRFIKYPIIVTLFISKIGMSQNFTEPVWINFSGYGPKLILNDPNTANKVPIEFRTNNVVKWELGMRPISGGHDMALWNNYNGTYFPVMWFKHENRFVGIGTNSPEAKLEIESTDAVYTETPTILIRDLTNRGTMILESVTDNPADFVFKNKGKGRVWMSSRNSSSDYSFNMYTSPNGTGVAEKLVLRIKQNGNFGIGQSDPTACLDILGPTTGNNHTDFPTLKISSGASSGRAVLWLDALSDNPTDFVFRNNGKGRVWMSSRNSSNNYSFNLYTSPGGTGVPEKLAMQINQNGDAAFYGKLEAKEIKVTLTPTADFVFNDNYELKDLEEVEEYISEKKHLPNVECADEMAENGINVAVFQIKLLQKIEELTLYMIEQNKEAKSIKAQLDNLAEENDYLKAEIENLKETIK